MNKGHVVRFLLLSFLIILNIYFIKNFFLPKLLVNFNNGYIDGVSAILSVFDVNLDKYFSALSYHGKDGFLYFSFMLFGIIVSWMAFIKLYISILIELPYQLILTILFFIKNHYGKIM